MSSVMNVYPVEYQTGTKKYNKISIFDDKSSRTLSGWCEVKNELSALFCSNFDLEQEIHFRFSGYN